MIKVTQESVSRLMREIESEFPDFSLRFKDESPLMRAIDVCLRILTLGRMKTFMTTFHTVIGYTFYASRSAWHRMSPVGQCVVLRHERVHMRQRRKYGMILYSVLYLFLPLPGGLAYFRMRFEREAYEESIRAAVELAQNPEDFVRTDVFRNGIINSFCGPAYFYMWPFRRSVEAWYEDRVMRAIRSPSPPSPPGS